MHIICQRIAVSAANDGDKSRNSETAWMLQSFRQARILRPGCWDRAGVPRGTTAGRCNNVPRSFTYLANSDRERKFIVISGFIEMASLDNNLAKSRGLI